MTVQGNRSRCRSQVKPTDEFYKTYTTIFDDTDDLYYIWSPSRKDRLCKVELHIKDDAPVDSIKVQVWTLKTEIKNHEKTLTLETEDSIKSHYDLYSYTWSTEYICPDADNYTFIVLLRVVNDGTTAFTDDDVIRTPDLYIGDYENYVSQAKYWTSGYSDVAYFQLLAGVPGFIVRVGMEGGAKVMDWFVEQTGNVLKLMHNGETDGSWMIQISDDGITLEHRNQGVWQKVAKYAIVSNVVSFIIYDHAGDTLHEITEEALHALIKFFKSGILQYTSSTSD